MEGTPRPKAKTFTPSRGHSSASRNPKLVSNGTAWNEMQSRIIYIYTQIDIHIDIIYIYRAAVGLGRLVRA